MKYYVSVSLSVVALCVTCFMQYGQGAPDFIYHIVKGGENAQHISLLYDVPIDSVKSWNYLDKNYRIVEGMRLVIKRPNSMLQSGNNIQQNAVDKTKTVHTITDGPTFHIVKAKDNLFRIGLQYHVSIDSIKHWNNLTQNNNIIVGQRLIINVRKREAIAANSTLVVKAIPVITIPSSTKIPSERKPISATNLVQVSDTSVRSAKTLPADSSITTPQRAFLPIYSDPLKQTTHNESGVWEIFLYYYHSSNFLFHFVLFLNLFFFTSSVLLVILLISRRIREGYIAFRKFKCQDRYRDFITSWLYDEHDSVIPESLIKELKNGINRDVFTSELLSLHNNLIGESADKLEELFYLAGFKKNSIQKVNRSLWHLKAKGFRELAQMKIKENYMIFKYLNSGNVTLRIEAQLAWIQLNPDDPLSFYDDPNVKLTEWGQLNLLLALKKSGKIPNFGRWLTSVSKSVSLFALRLTGNYKQFENADLVASRLSDKDKDIRREAISTLGKLALPSKCILLRELFPKEELENKTAILHSLIMMTESSNAPFFEAVLLDETDVNLRILAAQGLVSLGYIGKDKLDALYWEANPLLKKIIIHAKDDRI